MNNREYANTLSDDKFVEWGRKLFGTDWEEAKVLLTDEEISRYSVQILNQPHETTGHEDLVNAGWELVCETDKELTYSHEATSKVVFIGKEKTWYKAQANGQFSDYEIDFLRKCADKIRKEKGWVE